MAQDQFYRTYYGTKSDIDLAKQAGYSGKFVDVSKYGDGSKYKDILSAHKTGHNPIILGGAGAIGGINDDLYKQLQQAGANLQRIGGKDRYEVQKNLGNYMRDLTNKKNAYDLEQQRQKFIDQGKSQVNKLYDQQKSQVAPQFQQQRNQADAVNQQNAQRLREAMAASGLTTSGENVSAQVSLNNERQNSLNAISSQEQSTLSGIEAERARALIDSQSRAEEMAYQRSRDSISDDRYNQQFNYQRERDLAEDKRYQQEKATESQRYQQEKAWREYTYRNMSAAEKAQLDWAKSQFGEEKAWQMFQLEYNGELEKSLANSQLDYYSAMDFLP